MAGNRTPGKRQNSGPGTSRRYAWDTVLVLIDLHTHSTASDGTDSPAELVRAASAAGLSVVALTDHDTTAGWDEAAAASPAGLTLVRGMELSCTGRGEDGTPVPVHLLAYLFDPENEAFAAERARLRGERVTRLRAIAENMAADGLPIDPDAVLASAGEAAGRPHLGQALIEAGYVSDMDAAFAGPLATGGKYYVGKVDTPLDVAVEMIAAAGGVSVLAHARARKRGRILDLDHIRELTPLGLGGVEVHHMDHSPEDTVVMAELAAELDLIVTGSSDYHGTNKTVKLGEYTTAPEQYDRLIAAARS